VIILFKCIPFRIAKPQNISPVVGYLLTLFDKWVKISDKLLTIIYVYIHSRKQHGSVESKNVLSVGDALPRFPGTDLSHVSGIPSGHINNEALRQNPTSPLWLSSIQRPKQTHICLAN
jgi:hypothetical protein